MKKFIIILIVLCLALMIISLGLGARNDDKSREDSYADLLKSIGSTFDPDPVAKASVTSKTPCLSGVRVTVAKGVPQPCEVAIGEGETRVRKMSLKYRSGGKIDVQFAPRGGLPGDKPEAMCVANIKPEDCEDCCGEIELRIPEDGADLSVTCVDTSKACSLELAGVQ